MTRPTGAGSGACGAAAARLCVAGALVALCGCSWLPPGTAPRDFLTRPVDEPLANPQSSPSIPQARDETRRADRRRARADDRDAPSPVREATPLETREYAVRGRTLLTPVRIALREEAFDLPEDEDYVTLIRDARTTRDLIDVRLDGGEPVPATLHWIGWTFDPAATRTWLDPSGSWRATSDFDAVLSSRVGLWALAIDLSGAHSAGAVWIDGKRLALSWIDAPREGAGSPFADAPIIADTHTRAALRAALSSERESPLRRWRARLTMERFGATPGDDAFSDEALELMARQEEDRWRAALARLWRIDESLARSVLHALTSVAAFEGGAPVPAWSADGAMLARLRTELLDAARSDRDVRLRAEGWLAAQTRAVAWIVDDAIATRHVAVGVASLRPEPVSASAEFGGVDLRPLAPGASAMLVVEASDVPGANAIDVRIGDWRDTLYAMEQPIPCAPPGTLMGPLLLEHTMQTWLNGAPPASLTPSAEWATAALLQRRAGGDGWELLIECRTPPRAAPADVSGRDDALSDGADARPDAEKRPDFVRIWIGPGGGTLAALRVDSRGFIVDEAAGASDSAGARPIDVRIDHDRWTALLTLPERFTADGGLLLIGLERVDARGVRTTWPRPALPWQTAPGRVAVDLDAWRGLERVAPVR